MGQMSATLVCSY